MRLNLRHLPTAALASLPLAAAHWGWSTPAAAAALASVALARQAAVLTDVATRARPSKRKMVLETISLSHYAEKVRWTMDALGSDYVEEQDAAIMGVFLTGRTIPGLRVPNRNFTIYNSADILRYLYAKNYNDPARERFLRPTPEAIAWERKLDYLGDDLRRYAYSQILQDPDVNRILLVSWGMENGDRIPQWQKLVLRAGLPALKPFIKAVLRISPESGRKSLSRAKEGTLAEVDKALSDGRQFILGTENPTYIDITCASMMALLAFPDLYGGPTAVNDASRLRLESFQQEEVQREIAEFRSTPAGQFCIRMFREHRLTKL